MEEKIVEINGQITALDLVKKTVAIKGEDNAPHGFSWNTEPLDTYFKKQSVGYYQSFKYNPDTYLLKNAHYWKEGKEVMGKLHNGKYHPPKPRVTIGFTIAVAQFENVRVEVEGNTLPEVKATLIEVLDSLGNNHEPTKDLIQAYKRRLL